MDNTYTNQSCGTKVCDLFMPGEKQWDIIKVNNFFSNCDANAILALPIPKNQVHDRIAWMFTADGKYSVKSGYNFWHDNYNECCQIQNSRGWKNLWHLQVPQKVRVLIWRLCRNNVPVSYLLRGKGVQTTISCPMCITDIEHPLHIFLDCIFAKACWQYLGLDFSTADVESCPEWVLRNLA